MGAPSFSDVLIGIAAVLAGCIGGAFAIRSGYRSRNWFAYLCGLGCAAFVAGIAGQRSFPSAAAVARLGAAGAAASTPGPWDAGVSLPVIPIRLTPVTVVGFLVAAVGLSLLLLFEHVPDTDRVAWRQPRALEEDDTV